MGQIGQVRTNFMDFAGFPVKEIRVKWNVMSYPKVIELQFSAQYGHFGSKEHFFHYFWGYVLPGMSLAIKAKKKDEDAAFSFVLEDCGPVMNVVSREMFGLISQDIKFIDRKKFTDACQQVPRWDIMINFDSVLFEDEYSFRGSTKDYRENEFLKSVLNQPNFLMQFQDDMREVRSWVLGQVIGPEAAKSGIMQRRDPEPNLSGSPRVQALKKSIVRFLERSGPWHVRVRQKMLRQSLNAFRFASGKAPVAIGKKRIRPRKQTNQKCLLLRRSPEPEYYSEKGQAEAKKYGASRRSLVEINELFELFKSKSKNIEMYEPGSDNVFNQIKKFYNSKVVIGIKGAELSNIFWMTPDTKVFVVTPNTMRSTPVYQRFGRFLGLKVVTVFAADGPNPSVYRLRREILDQIDYL
ncbi:Protein of unknown function (DUF563) (plasmid) [Hoeflea sp. IMCC20628]|uniref:glycosyltransferase 61 family protein n=1 Tax=Hoeflea sp. IMCC20628 TaxID=1620421 RepID=UPI00063AE962|nr:glycosyltransferase family 61 protein [Hoeflea sp. IMCC20628]AKI03378.1 Protein of unknown function (DUF563) [Hoeflea sp. IMCC20628]